ncbi:MAG: ATP-dependent DNA ligase, partial [Saprospiraceae bacterium]|nr:ATP-dependent DNA ligase [Saprospiraceae bacterium]
ALTLPKPRTESNRTLSEWISILMQLQDKEEEEKREVILAAWSSLNHRERFIFNKIITGGFRVGVSQKLMTRALAKATGIDENILAHRMMGNWSPADTNFEDLILREQADERISRPYPFYLAYALDISYEDLGSSQQWQAEYKWDGIRGQLICRKGQIFLWSRGEDLLTDRFPEISALAGKMPDGSVIDGELLPYKDGSVLTFQNLQTRIGRKNLSRKMLENCPVILMAYDLLEYRGEDIRQQTLVKRRRLLENIIRPFEGDVLRLSPTIDFESWPELDEIRKMARKQNKSEGVMLKRTSSPYQVGRKKGDWWKWKIDPLTIDAVLLYAQQGHGRRANLFTDYTFAVWNGDQLVPFAKAYSGLTDKEFLEITKYVRGNTLERFGPVRSVKPNLVFEIAFEGIQASTRHKSGVALRFPRMLRWRKDKHPREANTIDDLKAMLHTFG